MNLDKMLTSAVQDLSWLEEPETYDVSKHHKKNDMLRELDLQWGNGATNLADEPIDVVSPRVVEDESQFVVSSARKLIASGRSGSDVVACLQKKYGSKTIEGMIPSLREAFELDGVAGCFAVDCEGFANCREALRHAKKSPFARFIAFVVNHDEEKVCHRIGRKTTASGGGSVDGLLSDERLVVGSDRAYCRELGLPVLSYDGVAPEFVDKTVIDLLTLGQISEDDAESIRSMEASSFVKLREAFRVASRNMKKSGKKYSGKVDVSEYKVSSDLSFDLNATTDMKALEVDDSGGAFGLSVDVNDEVGFVAQDVDRGVKKVSDFDVDKEVFDIPMEDMHGIRPRVESIDVDSVDSVDVDAEIPLLFDVPVNNESVFTNLDVDERGVSPEVDVDDEFVGIEIDPSTFVEDEFVGSDEFELMPIARRARRLDVDGRSDFSF